MLSALIKKEIKNNVLSMRFIFALLVVLIIVLTSLYIRIDDYTQSALDYQANKQGAFEKFRESHWWRFQWQGKFVERPVQPLSILVTGAEGNPDARSKVFEKARPLIRAVGTIDRNPLLTLTSPVDIMFITGIVMSLLVLVMSFDSVSGEMERGTLKLLLSFPVPRAVVLFAKWLGGLITLSIPFIVSYICAAVWILLSRQISFTSEEWIAYLLIGIASLLYIAWMFSASLLVSCWFKNSASSMCMLLFLWVLMVLILPNISPYIAASVAPVDSVQSVQFKSLKVAKEIQQEEHDGLEAIRKKYNTQPWWRHDKGWPEGIALVTEIHNKQRQATRKFVDERQASVSKQASIAHAIGRISPFTSYSQIVSSLAWTGPAFDEHLRSSMRQHEDYLREVVTRELTDGIPISPERIPVFRYTPPPVGQRFTAALIDWVVLSVGVVVFFLGAYVSFVTKEII